MLPIEAHKKNGVDCYFIEDNKAVSINNQEVIYWDISNIENQEKIFQAKSKKILPILDSNKKLNGLVIDGNVHLLADALFELCDDKTQFKGLNQRKERVSGNIPGFWFKFYLKCCLNLPESDKKDRLFQ